MSLAIITAKQVAGLVLIILSGFICGRIGIFEEKAKRALSDLLMYLVMPAMIMDSYIREYDPSALGNLAYMLVLSVIFLALSVAVTLVLVKLSKSPDKRILGMAAMLSNCAYMGFPLIRALFSEEGIIYASVFLTVFNILLWTGGYMLVSKEHGLGNALKKVVTCPAIIAVAAGLIVYFNQIPVPEVIQTPMAAVGDMNTPLSMVVIGLTVAESDLPRIIRDKEIWITSALRLVIIPLLSLALARILNLTGTAADITLILAACPCAAVTTVFAIQFGRNEKAAAGAVVLSTLLSVITLPVYTFLITL